MAANSIEQVGKVRTKIVATMGPASRDPAMVRRLVEAGVDVFRLNFSHGKHEEHAATYEAIQEVGRALGRRLAVLQDLCGPKIRLGPIAGDVVSCDLDAEFTLWKSPERADDPHALTSTYKDLADDLEVGQTMMLGAGPDSKIQLRCRGVPLLTGRMGRVGASVAVRDDEAIERTDASRAL